MTTLIFNEVIEKDLDDVLTELCEQLNTDEALHVIYELLNWFEGETLDKCLLSIKENTSEDWIITKRKNVLE